MNPKSTAQIAGHPINPMLIPFAIACFVFGVPFGPGVLEDVKRVLGEYFA
jgi:uncharacterized membrane protein